MFSWATFDWRAFAPLVRSLRSVYACANSGSFLTSLGRSGEGQSSETLSFFLEFWVFPLSFEFFLQFFRLFPNFFLISFRNFCEHFFKIQENISKKKRKSQKTWGKNSKLKQKTQNSRKKLNVSEDCPSLDLPSGVKKRAWISWASAWCALVNSVDL